MNGETAYTRTLGDLLTLLAALLSSPAVHHPREARPHFSLLPLALFSESHPAVPPGRAPTGDSPSLPSAPLRAPRPRLQAPPGHAKSPPDSTPRAA